MTHRRLHRLPVVLLALSLAPGCGLERLFPQDVGDGVARLTVRQAGAVLGLVNGDARCGFKSEAVLASPRVEGEIGGPGTVTWVVEECTFDLGGRAPVGQPDCNGEGASDGSGVVTVNATRSITGILTGDPVSPVVPAGPDAVTIDVDTTFEDFAIEGADGNVLTQRVGALHFTAFPRLAVANEAPGVCAAPTNHVLFADVRYEDAVVHVLTPERAFEVAVPSSSFSATNGVHGVRENDLAGAITLWDDTEVELAGDLDPEYDPARFTTSFAQEGCVPEGAGTDPLVKTVMLPVSFACTGIGGELAPGVARLGVQTLGTIAQLLEANTDCGFSSASVEPVVVADAAGRGTATWHVEACELRFPEHMVVSTNCQGAHTMASGRVVVTGEKRLTGRVTGDAKNPILPLDDQPAEIVLAEVSFDEFRVNASDRAEALHVKSGRAAGRVVPRTARGVSTGACSVPTPVARLSELAFSDVEATVVAPQGRFNVSVSSASLAAVNGTWGDQSNVLEGTITVDGESYQIPLPGDEGLVPGFDPVAFDGAWQGCADDLELPVAHDGCDIEPVLVSGAARLTVNLFGQVASALESDTACGFASASVIDSVAVSGELGRAGGHAVYAVEGCVIDVKEPLVVGEDCEGRRSTLLGKVTVSGTKTLAGIVSGDPGEPIVPTSWTPATLELTMTFDDLTVASDGIAQSLTVESGTLTGTVTPRTAIDTKNGACAIATPVARLDALTWTDARLRINSGENSIALPVSSSTILAQNGDAGLLENHLSGTLSLGDEEWEVPADTADPILDPSYDAAAFMAGFACTPDMELPTSEAACSFNKVLGEGAARLIVQAVGEAASMVNADGDCGFANLGILMDSTKTPVDADPGEMGALTFVTEGCQMIGAPDGPEVAVSEDCSGRAKHRDGSVTVTSTRVVEGELEEIGFFGITIADSIIPRARDAVTVGMDAISFDGFKIWSVRTDGSEDLGVLEIESGTATAVVSPVLGENADDPGVYMTPTPVSAVDDVQASAMTATLYADGKVFKLDISSTDLDAFNGTYQGRSNTISGTITVNGETITLAPQALDPEFQQSAFDAAYACTDNLAGVIPAN